MFVLSILPLLLILILVVVGLVFAGRGVRSTVGNVRNRSPLPDEYRRDRRKRVLRWIGAAAAVAVVGSLWAWLVRDPVPTEGWF